MTDIAIKVENLSKLYQLGEVGTGTLSKDLNRWWAKLRGKEDPYAKVGQVNDRTKKAESDFVWALKDINFEVKQGEVLGIIGKNGAGKSTLLKILSKITSPTTGRIYTKGRIASLLEVGTGFHPEMTGRENIYLNGAILGMRKWEIEKKFDEIVDFSGVEAYIDTPVKRYSSGMYVRLAFGVAAHLDPEILIVDEVLAVGDVEFQRKCFSKINDVARNNGRTILLVSHNMEAIMALSNKGILLKDGLIDSSGSVDEIINSYIKINTQIGLISSTIPSLKHRGGVLRSNEIVFEKIQFEKNLIFDSRRPIVIKLFLKGNKKINNFRIAGSITNSRDKVIGTFFGIEKHEIQCGQLKCITCRIINHNLTKGYYFLSFSVGKGSPEYGLRDFDVLRNALTFEVNQFNDKPYVEWRENWGDVLLEVDTHEIT